MNRLDELMKIADSLNDTELKKLVIPMIEEVVYLENELADVKKLPFIKVHPKDKTMQKILPAQKVYVSLLQQYSNVIRTLSNIMERNGVEDDSPLRAYLNNLNKGNKS